MSAVFKRQGDDEGMEMPVREVVSRAMLCTMFDLSEDEPLHIFNPQGEQEACLLVLDAAFTPKTAGDYIIKTETEVENERKGIPKAPSQPPPKLPKALYGSMETLACQYDKEAIEPVNVIYNILYEQPTQLRAKKERPFLVLKRLDRGKEYVLNEGQTVCKYLICRAFELNVVEKYYIVTPSKVIVKIFAKEISTDNEDDFFTADVPGVYFFMTESEMAESDSQLAGWVAFQKMSLFAGMPRNVLRSILAKLSAQCFARLSLTCHQMLANLQMTLPRKQSSQILNIITVPSNSQEFGLVLSKKNPLVMDPKYEFHPYHLTDLQNFELEAVVYQGDIARCEREVCLLKGARAIQMQNIAYKTFISHFNPLSIVKELMTILEPKRAEIWLCRLDTKRNVLKHLTNELSVVDWPFRVVTEELKLVTGTSRYLDEMMRTSLIFPYLSSVKIFQAVIVEPLTVPIIPQFFKDFYDGVPLGNLQMAQFVFRDFNQPIFDGLNLIFQRRYHDRSVEPVRQSDGHYRYGDEHETRTCAGIMDEAGERIAITQIRRYLTYHVVAVAFTSSFTFEQDLHVNLKKLDELQETVDYLFRQSR